MSLVGYPTRHQSKLPFHIPPVLQVEMFWPTAPTKALVVPLISCTSSSHRLNQSSWPTVRASLQCRGSCCDG